MKCPACEAEERDPTYYMCVRRSELPEWFIQRAEYAKVLSEKDKRSKFSLGYYLAKELIEYLKT